MIIQGWHKVAQQEMCIKCKNSFYTFFFSTKIESKFISLKIRKRIIRIMTLHISTTYTYLPSSVDWRYCNFDRQPAPTNSVWYPRIVLFSFFFPKICFHILDFSWDFYPHSACFLWNTYFFQNLGGVEKTPN